MLCLVHRYSNFVVTGTLGSVVRLTLGSVAGDDVVVGQKANHTNLTF